MKYSQQRKQARCGELSTKTFEDIRREATVLAILHARMDFMRRLQERL